jgi:hypothetical protein
MFHTSAFSSSIANSGALLQLTEIPDSILPASGSGLLSSRLSYLMALAGVGVNMTRGQFLAPSLRDYGNIDLLPINIGAVFESPPRVDDFSRKMIPLATPEEWDAFAAQNHATASQIESMFLWSSDGNIDPFPPKKIVQIRFTAAVTLTANKWSQVQPVLAQPLVAGQYALVGMRCLSAGLLAFRVVPSGSSTGNNFRPGGIGVQTEDQLDHSFQRKGGWGKWLDFTNTSVPFLELFSLSADTSEEGIFDLVPY